MVDPRQEFLESLEKMKDGSNDGLLESVADAFVVCEDADRAKVDAVMFLESQCGGDRAAFIRKLADIVEGATGDERGYAARGLDVYAGLAFPESGR